MPLPSRSGSSFVAGMGSSFPQKDVVIIHAEGTPSEKHTEVRAVTQSRSAFFDLDTPIYEGDFVEMADPRGGVLRYYVKDIEINDTEGSSSFAGMGHIRATWGDKPVHHPQPASLPPSVSSVPVINVHGGQVQIAWNNENVTQNNQSVQTVAPGYEELAVTLTKILQELQDVPLNADDKDDIIEAAETVLQEVGQEEPNSGKVRRGINALKGTLFTLAGAATSGAADGTGDAAREWAQAATKAILTFKGVPTT